jgi:hypothetical protein
MRANLVWLAFLTVGLWGCGSGGPGEAGDAGGGENLDGGGLEGSADAADGGVNDATGSADGSSDAGHADAGVADGASSDGASSDAGTSDEGDGAAPCTGMPQSLKGSCAVPLDPDAATSTLLDCIEYTGADPSLLLTCADLMGTSSTSPCPTAGLFGRCLQQCGTANETVGYDYLFSAAAYRQSCESGGGVFLP